MILHTTISDADLRKQFRLKNICLGGNRNLKIYGTLHCASGKRLKKENRVFFATEIEALQFGFRPCGYCMKPAYLKWKNEFV